MKTKTNIYDQITNQIINQMENGIIPWQKPWTNGKFMGCVSHTSGRPYSMLNQILLGCKGGEYLTYAQIQAEGGRVKAGEKSQMVVFWKWLEKKEEVTRIDEDGHEYVDEDTKRIPYLTSYAVFHIDQTEGIEPKWNEDGKKFDHEPMQVAEDMIASYVEREGVKLVIENGNRAFYRPSQDLVSVPELAQYEVCEEYYSTLFHELTHSTGHAKRLNREGIAGVHFFGDEGYSKEELVAEMGAAFICNMLGMDCKKAFKNSVAYIQSWLGALRNDKKMIVMAATKAEQAANYILNNQK
jgi:antirestriction protein ArdC